MSQGTIQGTGNYRYRVVEGWGMGPQGRVPGGIATSVAADSQGRVYVFVRKPAAVLVFDSDGRLLRSWGEELFTTPHSIWIDERDRLFIADCGDHTIRICTPEGQVLQTLGTPGQAGAPGMPFNMPTWACLSPVGDIFVSDGYGQFRIHRFTAAGRLLRSWGEQGKGPGQFALPHSLRVDRQGRVLAVDRENNRLQIFDADGTYLQEWTDVLVPMDVFVDGANNIIVAEAPQRISVFSPEGTLLARWGEKGAGPGQFSDSPHSIWVDTQGDLYISEVIGPNRIQKFEHVPV